jgi:hypothetical protein
MIIDSSDITYFFGILDDGPSPQHNTTQHNTVRIGVKEVNCFVWMIAGEKPIEGATFMPV